MAVNVNTSALVGTQGSKVVGLNSPWDKRKEERHHYYPGQEMLVTYSSDKFQPNTRQYIYSLYNSPKIP